MYIFFTHSEVNLCIKEVNNNIHIPIIMYINLIWNRTSAEHIQTEVKSVINYTVNYNNKLLVKVKNKNE